MREPERMAARRLRDPTGVRPRVRRSLRSALGVKTLSRSRDDGGGACVDAAAAVVAATSSAIGADVEKARTERPRRAREDEAIVSWLPLDLMRLELWKARMSKASAKTDFFVHPNPPSASTTASRLPHLFYYPQITMATRRAVINCARWRSAPSVCLLNNRLKAVTNNTRCLRADWPLNPSLHRHPKHLLPRLPSHTMMPLFPRLRPLLS